MSSWIKSSRYDCQYTFYLKKRLWPWLYFLRILSVLSSMRISRSQHPILPPPVIAINIPQMISPWIAFLNSFFSCFVCVDENRLQEAKACLFTGDASGLLFGSLAEMLLEGIDRYMHERFAGTINESGRSRGLRRVNAPARKGFRDIVLGLDVEDGHSRNNFTEIATSYPNIYKPSLQCYTHAREGRTYCSHFCVTMPWCKHKKGSEY